MTKENLQFVKLIQQKHYGKQLDDFIDRGKWDDYIRYDKALNKFIFVVSIREEISPETLAGLIEFDEEEK